MKSNILSYLFSIGCMCFSVLFSLAAGFQFVRSIVVKADFFVVWLFAMLFVVSAALVTYSIKDFKRG